MTLKKRYLDLVGRVRGRLRKTSLSNRRLLVAVSVFILTVVILSIEISPFGYRVEAGKPSPRKIRAPKTVQYIDSVKTEEQREAAAEAVQDVYVVDKSVAADAEQELKSLFEAVSEAYSAQATPSEKVQQVQQKTRGTVEESLISGLLALPPDQRLQARDASLQVLSQVMKEEITEKSLGESTDEAKGIAQDMALDQTMKDLVSQAAISFIQPNARIDEEETEKRKKAAAEAVSPVITTKLEGEVIVDKGEVVTEEQLSIIKSLGFKSPTFTPINMLYFGLFGLLLLGVTAMFLAKFRRGLYDSPGLLALLGGMFLLYTVIAKLLAIAAGSLSPSWGFFMPIAAVAFISAVLIDSGVAIVIVVLCALITGAETGGNFSYAAFVLLGGIFPSIMVSRLSSRHELRRAGLYTALWVAFVAFGTSALTQLRQNMLLNAGIGFLNGILCTIIAMGSLPFLETTFRVTTNTWLLELASPEQPLLKELSVKAPGTYSHSVMVANLAEAAAREIGSDPMLARVAAYYHDVGKIKRPQFFVENQPENESPHEKISSNLSALVITSHVKDGVEMLEKHHIPPAIVDIVRQHHGTSLVKYFYEQAVEESDDGEVDENRFRYHFEKPRSRTACILLLADAVEAAARTLRNPSASAIEQMVDRIVEDKIDDGQLDDSKMTFDDVHKVKSVFSKILITAYHPRIDYPSKEVSASAQKKIASQNKLRNAGATESKAPG